MTAQLKDVVSGGVAEDGSKLWLNLRLETETGEVIDPAFEADPLVTSKLIQAVLSLHGTMRQRLNAAAGGDENALNTSPPVVFRVVGGATGHGETVAGQIDVALVLKAKDAGELVFAMSPDLARELGERLIGASSDVPTVSVDSN
jgi:hypothetical protein